MGEQVDGRGVAGDDCAGVRWPDGWRAAIVGCGSAGSRVARCLLALGVPREAMTGYDVAAPVVDGQWPAWIARETVRSGERGTGRRGDVWFICTPASWRIHEYRRALDEGAAAIFAEKPFCDADYIKPYEEVAAETQARGIVTQVGYCWRWHPAVRSVRRAMAENVGPMAGALGTAMCYVDMSSWPGRDYGNPIAELSHELDIMRHLLGPGRLVSAERLGHGGYVISLVHDSGARSVVSLRGDFDGYFRGFSVLRGRAYSRWDTTDFGDAYGRSVGLPRGLSMPVGWEPNDMYRDELASFLASAIAERQQVCPFSEGLEVARWCAEAKAMIEA